MTEVSENSGDLKGVPKRRLQNSGDAGHMPDMTAQLNRTPAIPGVPTRGVGHPRDITILGGLLEPGHAPASQLDAAAECLVAALLLFMPFTFDAVEKPAWMDHEQWDHLPASITVREVRRQVRCRGFRPITVTIITTLLDPDRYPAEELIEVRLTLRHLKTTPGMDVLKCKSSTACGRSGWCSCWCTT